jgi:hypothetical protein
MLQNIVVAGLVAGCFVYALWTLAPKAARGRVANALLKMPLPLPLPLPMLLRKRLQAALQEPGGCGGCGGCTGKASPEARPTGALVAAPLAFYRRVPRNHGPG